MPALQNDSTTRLTEARRAPCRKMRALRAPALNVMEGGNDQFWVLREGATYFK